MSLATSATSSWDHPTLPGPQDKTPFSIEPKPKEYGLTASSMPLGAEIYIYS